MRFSERIGKRQQKVNIQIDTIDLELKNGIWNVLTIFLIDPLRKQEYFSTSPFKSLIELIWSSFLKETTDQITPFTHNTAIELRKRFFEWDYLTIYDFVDFLASVKVPFNTNHYIESMNLILKRELSGYRFINGQLSPITNDEEILTIEKSLSITSKNKLIGVHIHLNDALNKLSDRKNPDYRNSIKESISALEALCQIITGERKAELGKTLKILKDKIPIHSALEQGFIKIYGFASDSNGIRHATMEESNLEQEDALFMLISCSAFINYLISKAVKIGLIVNE